MQPTPEATLELINEYDEVVREHLPQVQTPLSLVYEWLSGQTVHAMTLVYRHHNVTAMQHRNTHFIYIPVEADTINLYPCKQHRASLQMVKPASGTCITHAGWMQRDRWFIISRAPYNYGSVRRRIINYARPD